MYNQSHIISTLSTRYTLLCYLRAVLLAVATARLPLSGCDVDLRSGSGSAQSKRSPGMWTQTVRTRGPLGKEILLGTNNGIRMAKSVMTKTAVIRRGVIRTIMTVPVND